MAEALAASDWEAPLLGVRINDWTTPWTHADLIEVVAAVGAAPGARLDVVVLPKVSDASHVQALDLLLTQLGINSLDELADHADEFDGKIIGIEPGAGLTRVTKEEMLPAYGIAK